MSGSNGEKLKTSAITATLAFVYKMYMHSGDKLIRNKITRAIKKIPSAF
jgi:hypothetical protein